MLGGKAIADLNLNLASMFVDCWYMIMIAIIKIIRLDRMKGLIYGDVMGGIDCLIKKNQKSK